MQRGSEKAMIHMVYLLHRSTICFTMVWIYSFFVFFPKEFKMSMMVPSWKRFQPSPTWGFSFLWGVSDGEVKKIGWGVLRYLDNWIELGYIIIYIYIYIYIYGIYLQLDGFIDQLNYQFIALYIHRPNWVFGGTLSGKMQHCRQMVGYFWIKLPGKPGIPGCSASPTKSEASEPHLLNRYDGVVQISWVKLCPVAITSIGNYETTCRTFFMGLDGDKQD